jgi:membrane-bound metal-dependent hydrolase YbcI (DUF457 family)
MLIGRREAWHLPAVPFTFAHPAAAVPLLRPLARFGALSALVIGSVVPDFCYFLPFRVSRTWTHSIPKLFLFCIPAGLVAYWLFHHLLARPVVDLFPASWRSRLRPVVDAHVQPAWTAVVVSLLVGAATHIAWDAFTHAGAPLVRVSRALRFHLVTLSGYPLSVHTVLQHLSTALGFAVIAYWIWRWYRRTAERRDATPDLLTNTTRAIAIAAVVAVTVALCMESKALRPMSEYTLRQLQFLMRRVVPLGISAFTAALLLYAAVWQLTARVSRR